MGFKMANVFLKYIFLLLAFKQLVPFYFDDKSLVGIEIPHNFCLQSSALSPSILAQGVLISEGKLNKYSSLKPKMANSLWTHKQGG